MSRAPEERRPVARLPDGSLDVAAASSERLLDTLDASEERLRRQIGLASMSVVGNDAVLVVLWAFFGPALLDPGVADPGPHYAPLGALVALLVMSVVLLALSLGAKLPLLRILRDRQALRGELDARQGPPPKA